MNGLTRRALKYRMLFPNVTSVWGLLDSLSHEPGGNLRMPPGRPSRKESRGELERSGPSVRVVQAIHRCAQCGVELTAARGHQCLIPLDPHQSR